jgi:adenylate kinase
MATRTISQAEALDDFLETMALKLPLVALEADDEILIQRLLEEEKLVGLTTKMKKNKNRYQEYNEKLPLMGYYNKQGKFYAVNGIGTIRITERLSSYR